MSLQMRESASSCPTCGLPTSVFLVTAPDVRCPHCRDAWRASMSNGGMGDTERDLRSIEDLI
jgi:ribosomal protein S27E